MLIEFKTSTQITLQNMIENQVKLGNEIMIVKSAKCDNDKIDKIIKSVDELTIEVKGERKKEHVNRNAKDDTTRMKNDDQPKTKTNQQKRIKNKDKLLYLTDSIGRNIAFPPIEKKTGCIIKTATAYSSTRDQKAKHPEINLKDVARPELEKSDYDYVLIHNASVDTSNVNTLEKPFENMEKFQAEVKQSRRNIFSIAENAIEENPNIKKIVICDQTPRFDLEKDDPYQIKAQLATFGNAFCKELLETSKFKDKIVVGEHKLEMTDSKIAGVYGAMGSANFDGIHMRGVNGKKAFTSSIENILKEASIIKEEAVDKNKDMYTENRKHENNAQSKQSYSSKVKKGQLTMNLYTIKTGLKLLILFRKTTNGGFGGCLFPPKPFLYKS